MYIHRRCGVAGTDELLGPGEVFDPGPGLVVVWADPGVTTGWAVVRVPIRALLRLGQVESVRFMWWRVGQYRSPGTTASVSSYLALCRAAWERAGEEDVVVIGYEGFSLQMLSTDPALLEPVRFEAVLLDRLAAASAAASTAAGGGVVAHRQMPGERTVITDARLRLWGLWVPGMDHGRDALRHALVFLRRFASQEMLRKRVGWDG
jgi:hypothetical protein